MSKVFIEEATLSGIGDAIREKEGSQSLIPVSAMAERIKAISGGDMEYTTGSVTFARSNTERTFPHGLSKAPKLFLCFANDYTTRLTVRIVALVYTEKIATVYRIVRTADSCSALAEASTVPGNSDFTPAAGAVAVDADNVYVEATNNQWEAGDYTWEAWTW